MKEVTVSRRQAGALIRLLGGYQNNLESLIECHTVDGKVPDGESEFELIVLEARQQWREAEDLIIAVHAQIPQAKAPGEPPRN